MFIAPKFSWKLDCDKCNPQLIVGYGVQNISLYVGFVRTYQTRFSNSRNRMKLENENYVYSSISVCTALKSYTVCTKSYSCEELGGETCIS